MSEISTLRSRTRQAMQLARAQVLADAQAAREAHGPTAIIVTHLANAHDVAPLTVRRWLKSAGFDLSHLKRGRPTFARLAELADEGSEE